MSGIGESMLPKAASDFKSEFEVYINKGELKRIHEWVKEKPDIETGGDLFGLWIDASTAVVQFVLGPGKDCYRTTSSFYQDISYLEYVGNYFTKQHGLCNIGQWHSHHTIPLFEPSAGDRKTVWSNMPKLGMERYIVFIANIKDSEITVNCFLFEIKNGQKLPVKKGEMVKIPGESPMRSNNAVMEIARNGAESLIEKGLVPWSTKKNSSQNETEKTAIVETNDEIPAKNGMGGSPGTHDKNTTVSATSISQSNEIPNSNEKGYDNLGYQNDNELDYNINDKSRQEQETITPNTLPKKDRNNGQPPKKDRKKQGKETKQSKSVSDPNSNTSRSNNDEQNGRNSTTPNTNTNTNARAKNNTESNTDNNTQQVVRKQPDPSQPGKDKLRDSQSTFEDSAKYSKAGMCPWSCFSCSSK